MFDLGFLQATANVPTNWLGLSVLAAIVSGIVAFGVAVYNARNARTSLDEGRAYTERLTRVNPYIELLQLSMHQCMDLSTIIDAIQRHPFSSKLQLLRLENSGGAQVWGETGVQLSRLRFSIVLVLQSQQAVLSFLEKTAQLSVTQAEALDRVKEGRMEEFIAQRQDYMKVAVEIIDLVRVETRKQQDRDHVESFSLNDAQIQQLLLQGALSELKFKLLPADFFWAAWWGFDDLTGPGEEDSDVAVFLPVFTRLEAILKKKATHLDIRTERILDVPRTKVRHRREVHCKENFFAIYVSFPSQASLDSFVPVLEAVKLQSKSIWASPFLPREMRSNS